MSQALRHAHRECRQNPTPRKLQRLFSAESTLLVENALYKHENAGLRKTLQMEKMRKGKKGQRLQLLGDDHSGPIVFSPAKVIAARAYQEQRKAAEEDDRVEKATKKAQAASRRQQRDEEKERRALARQIKRQLAQEEKTRQTAEKQAKRAEKVVQREQALAEKVSIQAPKLSRAAGQERPVGGEGNGGGARKRRKPLPAEGPGRGPGPVPCSCLVGACSITQGSGHPSVEELRNNLLTPVLGVLLN